MLKIKEKNHLYPFPYNIKLANKLIYSKVKPAIGMDRARVCVSGAAPISQEILGIYVGLGLGDS